MTLSDDDIARCQTLGARHKSELRDIADEVCALTMIPVASIFQRRRGTVDVSEARQIVCYIARARGMSYLAIARALGRDHTTVIHAVKSEAARRGLEYGKDIG